MSLLTFLRFVEQNPKAFADKLMERAFQEVARDAVPAKRKPGAFYIQRRGDGQLETVDEFTTGKEARAMLAEYRTSDPSAEYYVSKRACKAWTA